MYFHSFTRNMLKILITKTYKNYKTLFLINKLFLVLWDCANKLKQHGDIFIYKKNSTLME